MRPVSEDGRDNITRLERGPQGSGGDDGSAPPGHCAGKTVIRGPLSRSDGQTGDNTRVAVDQAERGCYRPGKGRRELAGT